MKQEKQKQKRWLVLLLAGMMATGISACAGNTSSGPASQGEIRMEDIEWSMGEGVTDGKRTALLTYANHSKYSICGFSMTFVEKETVTEEDRSVFFAEVKETFGFEDEDIQELEEREISMHTKGEKIVAPGEEDKTNVYYYDGFFGVQDAGHCDLVEPDLATIQYIKDGSVNTVYYDFSKQTYSVETTTELAYQWSSHELGEKVPKPETERVHAEVDGIDMFSFTAYGMSAQMFQDYMAVCKEQGYTVNANGYGGFYSAENTEGIHIDLYYKEDDAAMTGTISQEKAEEEVSATS